MAFFDLNTMREQDDVMQCPYCFEKSFIHKESLRWKIQ